MTANRSRAAQVVDVDTETLRQANKDEYKEVAEDPGRDSTSIRAAAWPRARSWRSTSKTKLDRCFSGG